MSNTAPAQPVQIKMAREEYRKTAPALAYELGSATALVKFADEYPQYRDALHGRLLPDHTELLTYFQQAGAQIAGQN